MSRLTTPQFDAYNVGTPPLVEWTRFGGLEDIPVKSLGLGRRLKPAGKVGKPSVNN